MELLHIFLVTKGDFHVTCWDAMRMFYIYFLFASGDFCVTCWDAK